MSKGHPDWQTWSGRSVGGEEVESFVWAGEISADNAESFYLGGPEENYEWVLQNVQVSCSGDDSIDMVKAYAAEPGNIIFWMYFNQSVVSDFPGIIIPSGYGTTFNIYNYSSYDHNFSITVNYIPRRIE